MNEEFTPVLENEQDLLYLLRQEIPDNEAFDAMTDRDFSLLCIAAKECLSTEGIYIILTYLNEL